MNEHRWLRRLGCGLATALTLASCGGGGGGLASAGGGVGTGGTGISYGTVTGFGSIVLDGQAYSSATPYYYEDGVQGSDTQQAATAVELGDRLSVQIDASGNPTTVVIEPELIGTVGKISSNGFTVNGVNVIVNNGNAGAPTTYYAGLDGLSSLVAGTQVEVHGAFGLDAGGQPYVQATLVQQLPSTNQAVRITGLVSQLGASSFVVDGITVNYSASTSLAPSGVALADGELVNVWSASPIAANAISAGAIRIRTLQGQSGQARIAGLVAQLQGTRFSVSGVPIDASAVAASAAALHLGDYVVVQGSIAAASGVVQATSISGYASTIELKGTITGYVGTSNFLVRGVPVDASAATFSSGAAASLGNGVYVDLVGMIAAGQSNTFNTVSATSVAVLASAPDGGTADYRGTIGAVTSGGFTLNYSEDGTAQSVAVALAGNVQYSNGTATALVAGAAVEVEGTVGSSGLTAYSVSFVSAPSGSGGTASSSYETSGLVYNYDSTAGTFVVNGLTMTLVSGSQVSGTLQNGVKVDVNFTQAGSVNQVQSVSIDH